MPFIIGVGSSPFKKHADSTFDALTRLAVNAAIKDTGLENGQQIDSAVFGNCAMHAWGQANIRGQVLLTPLQEEGTLSKGIPIVNVEAGCATGLLAFHTALCHVLSGMSEISMAVGVEKLVFPDDPKMFKSFPLFAGGIDQLTPESWLNHYPKMASQAGLNFSPDPRRLIFLDVHALQAMHGLSNGWIEQNDIATVAAKNHCNGTLNPLAQYRFDMTKEQVLSDRAIVPPLTRSMCAPLSDGSAAVVICSDAAHANLPSEVQKRAIRIRGCALHGGQKRALGEPDLVTYAAKKAYSIAELNPSDIQLAEVHDSTAFCEIKHLLSLGLSSLDSIQNDINSGTFHRSGRLPVNASGGLISKGHPLGATGLGMLFELTQQLRREAGEHQIDNVGKFAAAHNGGGLIGLDEALCGVTLLERPWA